MVVVEAGELNDSMLLPNLVPVSHSHETMIVMALYVVLRHPNNPEQVWSNGWLPDDRLVDAIMTNSIIAPLCEKARRNGEYVYVHRCAWGGAQAEITCRAKVSAVTKVGRDYLISFHEPESEAATPPVQPRQGDDYYTR